MGLRKEVLAVDDNFIFIKPHHHISVSVIVSLGLRNPENLAKAAARG